MRIHALLHVPFEGIGHIGNWAAAGGHQLTATRLYAGEDLPPVDTFDRLVIMGGPMNINQESRYPWLKQEKHYIAKAVQENCTIIGICLGAQLLADVLGARVYPGDHKEIGWFPITLTEVGRNAPLCSGLSGQPDVFHWHGDTFELPRGAALLARSEGCTNQAFLYEERILGLQFHLESTPDTVRQIVANCRDELVADTYVQSETELLHPAAGTYNRINEAMEVILDKFTLPSV